MRGIETRHEHEDLNLRGVSFRWQGMIVLLKIEKVTVDKNPKDKPGTERVRYEVKPLAEIVLDEDLRKKKGAA